MRVLHGTLDEPALHRALPLTASLCAAVAAEAAWKDVVPAFDVPETTLAKQTWLTGPAFSAGDLNVAGALYRGPFMDLGRWPHVRDWLQRCWDHPAAKKARAMRE